MKCFRRLLARVVGTQQAETFGLHGLRVSGYNAARRVNRELAVAQGAWDSDAHERYDRFMLSEVVSLPTSMISIATGGDDARFAAPSVVPPTPPVLTVGPNAPLALPPPRADVDLPAPQSRIRVFWTEEGAWFNATVTSHATRDEGVRETRVVYDPTPQWPSRRANSYWHDLSAERWEALPADGTSVAQPGPSESDERVSSALVPVAVPLPDSSGTRAGVSPISHSSRPRRLVRPIARLPACLPGEWSSAGPLS